MFGMFPGPVCEHHRPLHAVHAQLHLLLERHQLRPVHDGHGLGCLEPHVRRVSARGALAGALHGGQAGSSPCLNRCSSPPQACVDCATPSNCTACDSGWRAQNGTCAKWCVGGRGGGTAAVCCLLSAACATCCGRPLAPLQLHTNAFPFACWCSCSPEGCSSCNDNPAACDAGSSCLDSFGPADDSSTCRPCSVANCTACGGSYDICTECPSGFRLDARKELCEGEAGRPKARAAIAGAAVGERLPARPACPQPAPWSAASSATMPQARASFVRCAAVAGAQLMPHAAPPVPSATVGAACPSAECLPP